VQIAAWVRADTLGQWLIGGGGREGVLAGGMVGAAIACRNIYEPGCDVPRIGKVKLVRSKGP
jgi:hypothetical protein